MTVADVVREQRPLGPGARLDDEHRLRAFDDDDDEPVGVEKEAVTGAQDGPPRERRPELDATVGLPAAVHVRAILPAERHRIARPRTRRGGELALLEDSLDDGHGAVHKRDLVKTRSTSAPAAGSPPART